MSERENPLVFNRQDKIEKDEDKSETKDLKFKGLHDHSQCLRKDPEKFQDGDLIENEGDTFEDFNIDEGQTDHSKCTTIWEETWEDSNDGDDLSNVLLGQ